MSLRRPPGGRCGDITKATGRPQARRGVVGRAAYYPDKRRTSIVSIADEGRMSR